MNMFAILLALSMNDQRCLVTDMCKEEWAHLKEENEELLKRLHEAEAERNDAWRALDYFVQKPPRGWPEPLFQDVLVAARAFVEADKHEEGDKDEA